jgi:tetratricopeptide (TPR) repeat protein
LQDRGRVASGAGLAAVAGAIMSRDGMQAHARRVRPACNLVMSPLTLTRSASGPARTPAVQPSGADGVAAMSNGFTPHTLAETLRDLFRAEASGRLLLTEDTGRSVAVHFSRGLIERAALEQSTEAGPSPPDPPSAPVPATSREAMETAFRMHSGVWRFDASEEAGAGEADVPRTLELLLRGIAAIERWGAVHRILASQTRALRPAPVPLFPIEVLPLEAHEGYLLSRMDGHTCYSELSSLLPGVHEDEVTRFVYASLVLGFVEMHPALVEPFQLSVYAEQNREERHREEKELELIDAAYTMLRTKNPYRILGVIDGASWDEIRQSYEERKASMRPDRFLPSVRARRLHELQILESGLVEAFLKIQSLRLDAVGEKNRDRSAEEGAVTDLSEIARRRMDSLKTDRQELLEQNERSAATYLAKARESFREGDFHNAVEFCLMANQQHDGNVECYMLLAEALAKNPAHRWQLRAEAAYKTAVSLDPWNPSLYLKVAEFYRQQGMEQRAARYFEKAYALAPSLRSEEGKARPR